MIFKVCSKCKRELPIDCFDKGKDCKLGVKSSCKECRKLYRIENREKIRQHDREYQAKNHDEILKRRRIKRTENSEYFKEYNKNYKEMHWNEIYQARKNRLKSDDLYATREKARKAIYNSIRRGKFSKSLDFDKYVGCSYDDFINHLHQTFKQNYGYDYTGESISVDHITPLITGKSSQEIMNLCHYSNLQLLKPVDNSRKGIRMDWIVQMQK